jgi:hypothetical protein
MFGGVPVICGPVESVTVTLNDRRAVLLWVSRAVHSTVVAPSENVAPDWAEQTISATGPAVSTADTANATVAPAGPVASTVLSSGTVKAGAVVSATVTVKLAFA